MEEQEPVDTQINQMVKKCMIHRFASELQHTISEDRKQTIREILHTLEEPIKKNNTKTKLDKIYENIENSVVKKEWTKLNHQQKIKKIKEFLKTKNNKKLEDTLFDMIEKKKLKSSYIDYNIETGIINAINLPKNIDV